MFNKLKDTLVSAASEPLVKAFGNKYLEGIGMIDSFKLDNASRKVSVRLLLDGEDDRLCSISIDEYTVTTTEKGAMFNIVRCSSSDRPWLNTIAERYLSGLELPIPEKFAGVVKVLVG